MKIELTEQQLDKVRIRLSENIQEETELRIKQDNDTYTGTGWDFAALHDEKTELENILNVKYIEV